MKNKILQKSRLLLFFLIVVGLAVSATVKEKSEKKDERNPDLLLEDFGDSTVDGAPMRMWLFIADTVMGGKSSGQMEIASLEGNHALHMTGDVSLENNGGFIQCRSSLKDTGRFFDASDFQGIKLMVKGNGHEYAVHLRTSSTWLPWQYYQAKFETTDKWQQILIPFEKFQPYSLKKVLNKSKIKSVAIVAIGEEMKADVYVDDIMLY